MAVALALEPHQDDLSLFCAFTCHAEKPHVVTLLRSVVQEWRGTGITAMQRERENAEAMGCLGCEWEQWHYGDDDPDWQRIAGDLRDIGEAASPSRVYAPLPEPDGHPHHNRVGELAEQVFGRDRVSFYVTYVNGRQRNEVGELVQPTPEAVVAKLRALACYESQIREPSTGHHFLNALHERIVR